MPQFDLMDRLSSAIQSLPRQVLSHDRGGYVGIILGSGLGDIAQTMEIETTIDTSTIEGLVSATAPSHAGQILIGSYEKTPMIACQGRVHLYEGHSALDVAMPVYLMGALGVETLIITNASGGLNPEFEPGQVVMISDHINLTGQNPLIGVDAPEIGARFPDMSRAYDRELRKLILSKYDLEEGIYVAVSGPSLETSAERRYFRQMCGDMVGMSTAIEVIAANHCGMRVLGLSVVTNKATGEADQQPDSIEEVLAYAAKGGDTINKLLNELLVDLSGARSKQKISKEE